jgi:tetratricopeptide (TPR) repeat protein
VPAWLGLGELYLSQRRWPDVDRITHELANGLHRLADAELLQARALLARRAFEAARSLLEDQIARDPRTLLPRLYLSRVCLQEAQAGPAAARAPLWDAAEQALRTVIHLDPGQASSWRNLALVLWHEQHRPADALAACRAGRFHCPADPLLRQLEERLLPLSRAEPAPSHAG